MATLTSLRSAKRNRRKVIASGSIRIHDMTNTSVCVQLPASLVDPARVFFLHLSKHEARCLGASLCYSAAH
jgi:hypothetical protein